MSYSSIFGHSRRRILVSVQLLEIIFLGAIAFLIISKFISILGTTDEDDPAKKSSGGSFFGEPGGMKDVTNSVPRSEEESRQKVAILKRHIKKAAKSVPEDMQAVFEAFPNFDAEKFLGGAKGAFSMIIVALHEKDLQTIADLVDKRYLDQVKELSATYGKIPGKKIEASIVDTYSLGNSVYVKVRFKGSTSKVKSLKEEWVFTKNIQQSGPDWFLCNIER